MLKISYCIAGNFRSCKFLHKFEFPLRIEFQNSNFPTSQVVQATPCGTRIGLIQMFRVVVRASFTIEGMVRGYHI